MVNSYIICTIDDDQIYQYTFLKILEKADFEKRVLVFNDGEEALNFLSNNLGEIEKIPDIIFLDINMPIMDGFQFMEEYIKIKPHVGKKITIYMVTSSVHHVDMERAKKISELSDYIVKPIRIEQLLELINNLEKDNKLK
jgi:CheY-like chemotaxis protein